MSVQVQPVTIEAAVTLEVFTIRYALAVLEAHAGNVTRAAATLGLSRFALARLIKRAKSLGLAVV